LPTSVWATVYYVNIARPDNSGDGLTPGTAWKTLHYAISQISNGDTVNVAAGTYSAASEANDSPLTVDVDQPDVTIQGDGAEFTIIDGSGAVNWLDGILINASNVTIKDLAVKDFQCGECDYSGIGITSSGTGSIIESCAIYNNDYGISVENSDPTISKNRIYDNNFKGIYVFGNSGTAAPIILNNLIYVDSVAMEDGIYVLAEPSGAVASPIIYHNTIDGGDSNGIEMAGGAGTTSPDIQYNIITNFTEYGIYNSIGNPSPSVNYHTVSSNGTDYTNCTVSNSIPADPLYIDPPNGNYRLQSDSPAIDAIPLGVGEVDDDIDGNPRPQGSGYDIGAYERTVSTAQTIPIPPGTQVADYRMVAFTMQASDSACTSVFGDEMGGAYDPANFKIGTYDAITGSYVECGSGLDIIPGRGYWMLARNGFDATVHGTPASMSDTDVPLDYNATTGNGWNQIGCPNAASYWWDDVQVLEGTTLIGTIAEAVTDDYIDKRLWCWENGSYYPDNDYMEQREGYWVKAKKANVSLRFRQSVQIAQVSNQDVMFAGLFKKAKTWMNKWILGSQVAIADSGDSPPMPMAAISGSSADSEGGDGGCFIATVAMH
jgi:parallel beta-helix repeat protein